MEQQVNSAYRVVRMTNSRVHLQLTTPQGPVAMALTWERAFKARANGLDVKFTGRAEAYPARELPPEWGETESKRISPGLMVEIQCCEECMLIDVTLVWERLSQWVPAEQYAQWQSYWYAYNDEQVPQRVEEYETKLLATDFYHWVRTRALWLAEDGRHGCAASDVDATGASVINIRLGFLPGQYGWRRYGMLYAPLGGSYELVVPNAQGGLPPMALEGYDVLQHRDVALARKPPFPSAELEDAQNYSAQGAETYYTAIAAVQQELSDKLYRQADELAAQFSNAYKLDDELAATKAVYAQLCAETVPMRVPSIYESPTSQIAAYHRLISALHE